MPIFGPTEEEIDPSNGVSAEEFNIIDKVSEEDQQMTAKAWSRVLGNQVAIEDNLIGYATYMGPNSAVSFDTEFGWATTLCKFQSVPVYVQEDWAALSDRADVKLTSEPVDHIEYMRREELDELDLHELKAIAKELGLVTEDETVARGTLITKIVEHELENETDHLDTGLPARA